MTTPSGVEGRCWQLQLEFWSWYRSLNKKIEQCRADPFEILNIFVANTEGRPKQLCKSRLSAGAKNPRVAVEAIRTELVQIYGDNRKIANIVMNRVRNFNNINSTSETNRMRELLYLLREIKILKIDVNELQFYELQMGQREIISKLPVAFQNKYNSLAYNYQKATSVNPDFEYLLEAIENFISEMEYIELTPKTKSQLNIGPNFERKRTLFTKNSEVKDLKYANIICNFCEKGNHVIGDCRHFIRCPAWQRMQFSRYHSLCLRCGEKGHRKFNCYTECRCTVCGRTDHKTAFHPQGGVEGNYPSQNRNFFERSTTRERSSAVPPWKRNVYGNPNSYGYPPSKTIQGQPPSNTEPSTSHRTTTTKCCSTKERGLTKVFSKTVLVNVRQKGNLKHRKCLAVLDEQSDCSYILKETADQLEFEQSPYSYHLNTMTTSKKFFAGSILDNLEIKGELMSEWISLPEVLTTNRIPDSKGDCATPSRVSEYPHLLKYAEKFPEIPSDAKVEILIGSNCPELGEVKKLGDKAPYVHITPFGFSLTGPRKVHDDEEEGNANRSCRTAVVGIHRRYNVPDNNTKKT